MAKRKWTYKVLQNISASQPLDVHRLFTPNLMELTLDKLDLEGWELVTHGENPNASPQSWWVFRRPIHETE